MENAKLLLQTVQNALTTADVHNMSTQQVLQEINLDVETYIDALKILYMHAIMTFYLYGEEMSTSNM